MLASTELEESSSKPRSGVGALQGLGHLGLLLGGHGLVAGEGHVHLLAAGGDVLADGDLAVTANAVHNGGLDASGIGLAALYGGRGS